MNAKKSQLDLIAEKLDRLNGLAAVDSDRAIIGLQTELKTLEAHVKRYAAKLARCQELQDRCEASVMSLAGDFDAMDDFALSASIASFEIQLDEVQMDLGAIQYDRHGQESKADLKKRARSLKIRLALAKAEHERRTKNHPQPDAGVSKCPHIGRVSALLADHCQCAGATS